MKHCTKCKVDIGGNNLICPLCKNELEYGEKTPNVFPAVPSIYEEQNIVFKILIFISILGASITLIVNYLINNYISWSLFVVVGIIFFWLNLVSSIYKRNNPNAIIFNQVLLLSSGVVVYDYLTGFSLWSITYAIPFICIGAMAEMFIVSVILKNSPNDYVIYLLATSVIGLAQTTFIFTKVISVTWPSLVCFIVSIVMINTVLLFCNKRFRKEFRRKFHI